MTAATTQPNVIFVLADDMGWGDLGVFYQNSRNFAANRNQPAFITPKLDAMWNTKYAKISGTVQDA